MEKKVLMKTRRRGLWVWGVLLCVLIALLAMSNNIIWRCLPDNKKVRFVEDLSMESSSNTRAGVDILRSKNDLLETLEISGWTFSETQENNDQKQVSILFKSKDKAYLVENVDIVTREDINSAFKNTVPIMGVNHGFVAEVATYNISDGIYDIYTYSFENTKNFGWYRTGLAVKKEGRHIAQIKTESVELKDETSELVTYAIDGFSVNEFGKAKVSGWGLIKGEQSTTKYYLKITDDDGNVGYYTAGITTRNDIAQIFGEQYLETGFVSWIPSNELPLGKLSLQVVIESENGIFSSSMKTFFINEGDGIITRVKDE